MPSYIVRVRKVMDYWLRDQRQPILRSPPGSNPEARTGTGREVHLVCNIKSFL